MKKRIYLCTTLFVLVAIVTPEAHAEGVNVQTFTKATGPKFETSEPGFIDEDALGGRLPENRTLFAMQYHFANNPLVEVNPVTDQTVNTPIDGIHTMQAALGYRVGKNVGSLVLPVHAVKLRGGNRGYAQAMGDLHLQFRREMVRSQDGRRAFSLFADLVLPTGEPEYFVSNGGAGIGLRGSVEQKFSGFSAVANLGFVSFSQGSYREIDYRRQIPYSLGVSVPLGPDWALNAEFFQTVTLPRNGIENPGELYLGAKFAFAEGWIGNAGASIGQLDFTRANEFRIHLGFQMRFGL